MPEILLHGCTPTPLAGYLKALGVFRLLATQADPGLRACWRDDRLCLDGSLDQEAILCFFLESYRPTPILAPWNGGSGFHPGDNQDGFGPLEHTRATRFAPVAQSIALGRRVLSQLGLKEKPDKEQKPMLLTRLRAEAEEVWLEWLDAAVVLTDGEPAYPPLLGTGGNDGRLDFTNNFLQHLVTLFDPEQGTALPGSRSLLEHCLLGIASPFLRDRSIGQFAPGQAGGANATNGFMADSLMNPWDFVLMLEGSLLLATAATRRLETVGGATLSYPFMVQPSGGGSGSLVGSDATQRSRGELWLPLWHQCASLEEIRSLFGEGRATVGRRSARDGLDFARAVGQLGVSRGIRSFERYGFMVRNGLSYLATPLGRFTSQRNPATDLLADLDRGGFLDSLRREARSDKSPAGFRRAMGSLESALFGLAHPGSGPVQVQRVLEELGDTLSTVARSPKLQETLTRLPALSEVWITGAADDSPEFRLALALAGLARIRENLLPVCYEKGRWQWTRESRRWVWRSGSLVQNLGLLAKRRIIDNTRNPHEAHPFDGLARLGATRRELASLLEGTVDEERTSHLLLGLCWCALPEHLPGSTPGEEPVLPAALAVLKPCFTRPADLRQLGLEYAERFSRDTAELLRLLQAGQGDRAVTRAWQRGRQAGLAWPRGEAPTLPGLDGARLLACLTLPLRLTELAALLPGPNTGNRALQHTTGSHETDTNPKIFEPKE